MVEFEVHGPDIVKSHDPRVGSVKSTLASRRKSAAACSSCAGVSPIGFMHLIAIGCFSTRCVPP
jgi:hypothetical protein